MKPWNDWYHCTLHTYGTWLRGDPRGWRARHHREHVDGDYKHPPPKGMYDELHTQSKRLMKRDPVRLDADDLCRFVLQSMLDRLREFNIPAPVASFDGIHAHVLAQCPKHNPRTVIGIAKQCATVQLKTHIQSVLKAHGSAVGLESILTLKPGEGLWAKRCHARPIAGVRHYDKSFGYISDHALRGAIVLPPPTPIDDPMQSFDPSGLLLDA